MAGQECRLDGQEVLCSQVTLNSHDACAHWYNFCPQIPFSAHYGVYLWLVALGSCHHLGTELLMRLAGRVITRPVERRKKRIETVAASNFAPDRTVEWNKRSWATSAGASTSWLKTWTA